MRAASFIPTSLPTKYVHATSALFVFKNPLKTNSGYFSGCAMTVTVARCPGKSWYGGISKKRIGQAAAMKRTAPIAVARRASLQRANGPGPCVGDDILAREVVHERPPVQ